MDETRDYLIWLADAEFAGPSMNGPSLVETLRSLSAEEAASTDTYEGYTAWGVALHVLFFKYKIGAQLGASLPAYTYDESGWPSLPDEKNEANYKAMIDDLEAFHRPTVEAFKAATSEKLEERFAPMKTSLGNAFAWLVAHDANHNAQIRNMGLPSLKEA